MGAPGVRRVESVRGEVVAPPAAVARETRAGVVSLLRADGRAPEAFIRHFEETGVLDGRLWPIRLPMSFGERSEPGAAPRGDADEERRGATPRKGFTDGVAAR